MKEYKIKRSELDNLIKTRENLGSRLDIIKDNESDDDFRILEFIDFNVVRYYDVHKDDVTICENEYVVVLTKKDNTTEKATYDYEEEARECMKEYQEEEPNADIQIHTLKKGFNSLSDDYIIH